MEELKGQGIGRVYGRIVITPVDLVLADFEENKLKESMSINLEEILGGLAESGVTSPVYIVLCVLAGLLAAFGLATKSIVIIIGSMIVSPLLSPIVLTSIGLLTPGESYLKQGILAEMIGLLIVALTGLFSGVFIAFINQLDVFFVPETTGLILDPCLNPEMLIRTKLDYATVVLAIVSGLAAGLIISRGKDVSIVGVAIAASICPPAANVGLVFSGGDLIFGLRALGWLLANIFLINISICAVLWFSGVAKRSGITGRQRGAVIRRNILWVLIFAFFAFLLFVLMTLRDFADLC